MRGAPRFAEYSALLDTARSRAGFEAQTTTQLHQDLFDYVGANRDRGAGIVEVGCFRGGSSVLLAYLCRSYGWPFYTVDTDPAALRITGALLRDLDLADVTRLHLGSLDSLAAAVELERAPVLVFVDAHHAYPSVVRDIRAVYRLNRRPHAVAFHDFSLRSRDDDAIRVDRAILDCFGASVPLVPIGTQFAEGAADDGLAPSAYWWESPGTEGVIVELPAVETSVAIH
jgi:predicted O-methyltransferase YrrM